MEISDKVERQQQWIIVGYELFAREGPYELKVERLARIVGKNKSSFYHYFTDIELFTGKLLTYHIEQAKALAVAEAACQSLDELIDLLVEQKMDLLFNRQLRIHRDVKAFERCFESTSTLVVESVMNLLGSILSLKPGQTLSQLLPFAMENFYLQITEDNINRTWLDNYFKELKALVRDLGKK